MVWKICLFLFLALSYPHGTHSTNIKDSIGNLEREFNTSQLDVAEGGAIFKTYLKKDLWSQEKKENERRILLAQIISKCLDLLINLTSIQNPKDVRDLVEVLQHYKEKYSESLNKAKDLVEIANVPIDNVKIQRKVIGELYDVISEVNKEEGKRKRRSRRQNPNIPRQYKPNPRG